MKLPGLVILYNPELDDVISNIRTYIDFLDILYVFDNSENDNRFKELLERNFVNIKYISFNENKGIAFALNHVCSIAKNSNYKWLLALDQDSSFNPSEFKSYLKLIDKEVNPKIALFCPYYSGELVTQSNFFTSGSILNLNAWNVVGGFDEKLFIDEVDGDYNFRLMQQDFLLLKASGVILNHNLGSKISGTFFGKKLTSDNHSALRKYYISRNRIYLMKRRPSTLWFYFRDSIIKFIVFILLESNKKQKFKMLLHGIYDGLMNNMGKYQKN